MDFGVDLAWIWRGFFAPVLCRCLQLFVATFFSAPFGYIFFTQFPHQFPQRFHETSRTTFHTTFTRLSAPVFAPFSHPTFDLLWRIVVGLGLGKYNTVDRSDRIGARWVNGSDQVANMHVVLLRNTVTEGDSRNLCDI